MVSIRPITPEDLPHIVRLVEDAGFPARSRHGWAWAFFSNPDQGNIPPGLVTERDGAISAMVGTQARRFMVHGEPQTLISGHTFIAGARGLGDGLALSRQALDMAGTSGSYALNNNASSAPFYKKIGMTAWLGERGRQRIEWPVRPLTMFTGQILTRLARNDAMYDLLSVRERFDAPGSQPLRLQASPSPVILLDPRDSRTAERIARLNSALCEASAAVPMRTAELYHWQMSDPDAPDRAALLGLVDADELVGLAQLLVTKPNSFEPAELDILDLVAHPEGQPETVIPALINAARGVARKAGLARLRLPFSGRVSADCLRGTGMRLVRHQAHDSAHAHFRDPDGDLAQDWRPTGFESDMFFALRTPPASTRAEIGPAP